MLHGFADLMPLEGQCIGWRLSCKGGVITVGDGGRA
jgi:hypothetical protein